MHARETKDRVVDIKEGWGDESGRRCVRQGKHEYHSSLFHRLLF